MYIDPAIDGLRSDPAPQLAANARMDAMLAEWRARAPAAAVLAEFERYARGADLAEDGALSRVLSDVGAARELVAPLMRCVGKGLARDPLAVLPLRHQFSGGTGLLQLASRGGAALSLVLHDGAAVLRQPPPVTIAFVDSERHELCLAGAARARIVHRSGPEGHTVLRQEPICIRPGHVLVTTGDTSARQIEAVDRFLLTLRLSRVPAAPRPSLEFRLADGALVHRASGDRGESRRLMALTVLARSGRADAAPLLAELARAGSADFRWQALRECLALDAVTGFATLSAIARDAADPLVANAGALRAQLIEAYPALAPLEITACPA